MPVPTFEKIRLPLLKTVEDKQVHAFWDVVERLANHFDLSPEDRKEVLPSGKQYRFANRVGWARTYLKKARFPDIPTPGKIQITQRDLDILRENPSKIDKAMLRRFPEFVEFEHSTRNTPTVANPNEKEEESNTPEEALEESYQTLRKALAQELLERVKKISPSFFEKLVIDLLVAMGYGGSQSDAGRVIGRSGDGGIDGIIKEDKLGLDAIYVQAKRLDSSTVGRPVVQSFAGSLEGHRAKKGVFITTSQFSPDAEEYVKFLEKKIVLIDGEQLSELMIDYGIGVSDVKTYSIKKIDLDYFEEE